jgi:uncharacterized membrane protein
MVVEHAVKINKPIDEVWAIFDQPELQTKWHKPIKSYEHVSGKGNSRGSVARVIYARDSGDTELTVTVDERKAPTHFVATYEGMQLPFVLTSNFSAIDDDVTEWKAEIEVRLSLLQKALGPILKGAMSDLASGMGKDFKKYVESR